MRLSLLGVLLTAAACSSPSPSETSSTPTPPLPAAQRGAAAPAVPVAPQPQPSVLSDVRITHLFSNARQPDEFRLVLRGDSVLTASAQFSIVSAAGDTLWTERFPATALLNYGINKYGENPTDAQRAHYIRKRAAEFFTDEAFSMRAEVPPSASPKQLNQAAWAEVKATGLPRFAYQLGEENGQMIGYSPKRGKAVVYYTCC
ncbi:hypothetical protein HER32_08735 [Hymenobacter sp. BT18]|uniref:hypothetical protein n=1 Tax=Hymenobacter sp. BT18 TaxID=2835648 RepID=UPI00143E3286|nr:hypothetical protein [Hymenobacter sp. BT18]QIX61259.1 hypothetical protein HER32_08735 [Hymenobacter sp. BT18]